MPFQPIKPKKVSNQIAEQIRSSILAGEFTPGEKLPPERELAEMFGVSRPSVREALNMLASSGLVMSYQGGGTVVLSLVESNTGSPLAGLVGSKQECALNVIEVRKGIESWTAHYAALRALPEDIRNLERIVEGLRQNLDRLKPSEDLDANFHLAIAKATHNFVWLHLMETIFDAMREFQKNVWQAIYLTAEDHQTLFHHHTLILESIRNRNTEAAQQAMLEHLAFAEQRSTAYVTQRQQ